jgi:hypothetical protein
MTAQTEWARCRDWIVSALETAPPFETIDGIEQKIADGQYQFWAGNTAAAVTEVRELGPFKVLSILHAGGELSSLIRELLPVLYEAAANLGCSLVMVMGRKGWERALKPEGYEHAVTVLLKEIPSASRMLN